MGKIEDSGEITSYFTAGAFFFDINNISINNEKMVVISINQGVRMASLNISGQPISIVRKMKHIDGFFNVFSNAPDIFEHLFNHKFLDLQVLEWALLDSLQFSVKLYVSLVNNFLAGMSNELSAVRDSLHEIWAGFFDVYTDGSLRSAGSADVVNSAAMYFPVLNISVSVVVYGFLSFILAELQAVVLSLEVTGNVKADFVVERAAQSLFFLLAGVQEYFLMTDNMVVSDSAHYFVRNIFWSICCAYWEASSGCSMVLDILIKYIN
ncbi:hypothetical protein G9A89_008737 [Geosiphon pyriformis]|nr:hypothetical protein G9A89_008737 [Geosiphon pyriformis]